MPIIKSAKKRVKQEVKSYERNKHFKTKMLTLYKKVIKLVKDGQKEVASTFISEAYSAIDTASKKNLIHKNNASRRKSELHKLVGSTPATAKKTKAETSKSPAKKTAPKKTPVKTATKKAEK